MVPRPNCGVISKAALVSRVTRNPGKFMQVMARSLMINVLLRESPRTCNSRKARQKLSTRAPFGGVFREVVGPWRTNQQMFGPDPEPNR
jgi:hypothetical protein